ncbi:MAG: dTMP kinase [uncultured bacterium (gcode 4)]|uniref:dTMP kinase n=1 Tax=uncultured bacterium (gcode 4) TaxID=1234023 RepID=K1XIL3_9BACT|nr:MAG: dTMP kinase [uncultured bacterium (gcode 4)]HBB04118.1 hypothetical protein [Candidatus Gracilibacteria bacterium]
MKGKFIVFYGINNLGKTTQAKLLIEKLKQQGIKVEFTKYAHYDLEPTGKLINGYLREGNPHDFSPREFQLLHFAERLQYETVLKEKLDQGINVIAEDYFPTAIAWGTGAGVDQNFLEYLHKFLRQEDLGFIFDGQRFTEAIESGHKHETDNPLVEKVREVHQDLAKKYGWLPINANDTIENIHAKIWDAVSKII